VTRASETHVAAARRYVARCRLAGDFRPYETLLREIVELRLATDLAAQLLRMSWQV
jgi:hypothetical protein